jgi:hypothetical protein
VVVVDGGSARAVIPIVLSARGVDVGEVYGGRSTGGTRGSDVCHDFVFLASRLHHVHNFVLWRPETQLLVLFLWLETTVLLCITCREGCVHRRYAEAGCNT